MRPRPTVLMQCGLQTILLDAAVSCVDPESTMQRKSWIRGATVLLVGTMLASPVLAATIFGTITQKGKPVAKAQLSLSCPGLSAPAQTQTDARGSYHFSVTAKGN